MTNQLTPDNLNELRAALNNQSYSPYHRRLQAIFLRSEGLFFKKIRDVTGYVSQTVENQVGLRTRLSEYCKTLVINDKRSVKDDIGQFGINC